jgi:hypothetical protein
MAILQVAKTGLGAVQNGRAYLDELANKYILKPKSANGIGGFVFDYEGEAGIHIRADITDHWAENNTAIQDHIAVHPTRITLRGLVGELVMAKPTGILGVLDAIQDKLGQVPAYLGKYTPQALGKVQKAVSKAQSTVNTVDQALSRVQNIVGLFDKSVLGLTKQQKAYQKLQGLLVSKQLLIIVTPFGTHNNMVAESISLIQPEETKSIADISVTLKQMRFVDTQTTYAFFKGGRLAQQSQSQTDKGKTTGAQADVSILYGTFVGAE